MKNIVIIGPPRCGKTTLAKMIVKRIKGYNLISSDNMRTAFANAVAVASNESNIVINYSIPRMQCYYYLEQSNRYEGDLGYVVDFSDYDEELFKKFSENSIVLFLGYSKFSKKELFNKIRKYDTKAEWTYYESDFKLDCYCEGFIEKQKKFEKYVKEHNCWYVDTSINRNQVLNKTFNLIKKIISI